MNKDLKKELHRLRGKACKRVLKAAADNDQWSMDRYAAINTYLAEMEEENVRKPI